MGRCGEMWGDVGRCRGLSPAQLKEHAAQVAKNIESRKTEIATTTPTPTPNQMARNIESRKTEILLSRRTLELQTLDLLCTQTALVLSAAAS